MLGRGVAEAVRGRSSRSLFSEEVVEAARAADAFVLNLECCVSDRGEPWPDPHKPFFFRAPPEAVDALVDLGVDCVTLANNHALDFGEVALLDTFRHLDDAGITWAGAGRDVERAQAPALLDVAGLRVAVIGVTDHPYDFSATTERAGVAYAELRLGRLPDWLHGAIATDADVVVVTPHWGPNMVAEPVGHVRLVGPQLVEAGATLVAGHSAHVFHGVQGPLLWDLGDFVDDYAVHPSLRNDLGLLWFVTLDATGPSRVEALPLKLDYCHTRVADGDDAAWIERRFVDACRAFGTEAGVQGGRLVAEAGPPSTATE